jgi:pyruvate formate lyase activating enzyme
MGEEVPAEEIAKRVLKDEIFMKGSKGGVTFSGGEPLMQVDLCVAIAKIVKSHGLSVAVDTCGYVKREVIDKIIPYTDAFLFDIKAIDKEVHKACTGVSNEIILDNIRYVDSLGIPIELRYPYVPGMNDMEAQKIGEFVKELTSVKKAEVLPYHNYGARKYDCLGYSYPLENTPVPAGEEVERAKSFVANRD